MSEFEVLVEQIVSVENHPNADRLTINKVRGYNLISNKLEDGTPRYKTGDWVVYCPEDSIIPEFLLKRGYWDEETGKGYLAGKEGNRVKALKLRGILSQGIIFPCRNVDVWEKDALFDGATGAHCVQLGDNMAEKLGITKYIPELPSSMSGEGVYIGASNTLKFEIENIKKFPDVLVGHDVVAEEKLHGTCMIAGYIPGLNNDQVIGSDFFVTSKGLSSRGIVLTNSEPNQSNVYVKTFHAYGLSIYLEHISKKFGDQPVYLLGEVFGKGIQDLQYSLEKPQFRAFGIFVGLPQTGRWIDSEEKYELLEEIELNSPPVLYKGPFDMAKILEITGGKSSLDGKTIREGVVITPLKGFTDPYLGRAILKSVSEEYLLRKGETTEFQ